LRAAYAPRRGRPSLPLGRYFRMLLVGYFEGIDSERGLEWRCADSLSLREFLRLGEREPVPGYSWLSRTRGRLPLALHDQVFTWVLQRLAEHGLAKGDRIGVDASTMQANAALRPIVRRERRELPHDADAHGAQERDRDADDRGSNPAGSHAQREDAVERRVAEPDPDAKIAKLEDGRTHLAYKREQAVDLDSRAVVAAAMHPADQGDTTIMPGTLANAAEYLAAVEIAPTPEDPAALVADKGYHSRAGLKSLEDGPWKSRIAKPRRDEFLRWHGDDAAAGRSTTTGRGCSPWLHGRRSSCAPSGWNAASR
jgi:transposase